MTLGSTISSLAFMIYGLVGFWFLGIIKILSQRSFWMLNFKLNNRKTISFNKNKCFALIYSKIIRICFDIK